VTRTLSLDELADETGAEVSLLRTLVALGVIKPRSDGSFHAGDVIRVDAVTAFLDAGVSLEKIGEAVEHQLFTFEYLDRFHPEPSARSPIGIDRVADSLGVESALLGSIYLAMGLPEPTPEYRPTVDEEDLLRRFVDLWRRGGDEALTRAARLVGEPARMLSEGWTRLYVEKIAPEHTVGPVDERIGMIVETTEQATRLAPEMFLWLLQTHLRRAIDKANIEGLEDTMTQHGLTLPLPDTLPAIAFVDMSGYTHMTEHRGDTEAVRASEIIRESSQRVAQSHRGSLVKLLGDGAMLHFDDVSNAVDAVHELVDGLSQMGLPAHAGIHAGSMMEHDGDYYGSTVNLASRIAGKAGAGEVLVSQAVAENADTTRFRVESLPPAELKGVDQPLEIYRVSIPLRAVDSELADRLRQ
jgi:adenylate cyclase